MSKHGAIGVFDSGVGGLSVLIEIRRLLPGEDLLYWADSGFCPYGERSSEFIQRRSQEITKYLLSKGAKIIVVACNTASVAALDTLRAKFPTVPFVGVEPAIKLASLYTKNHKVGVLATGVTLSGERFISLLERFAEELTVFTEPCPGLVEKVEAGEIDTHETELLVRSCLLPLMKQEVDVVVLGCTHYPFLRPLVEKIVGRGVIVVDTGAPVARQIHKVLTMNNALSPRKKGREWFYTSGRPEEVEPVIRRLWGGVGAGLIRV